MFHWFRNRRRARLRRRPFPAAWEEFLRASLPHYCALDEAEQAELRGTIQVFLAEKSWEGCGGLILTDEIRVTIAGQACLLLLGLAHNYYRNVESILVYPSTVTIPERTVGVFERVDAPLEASLPVLGQAIRRGPVILVWDAVLRNTRHHGQGHNVVYHEFAHKLDMLDGAVDGTPILGDREQLAAWVETCSREFLTLRRHTEQGRKTFLDAYGAANEGEFFAVATEAFFDQPQQLKEQAPDLYRVLSDYYCQDPVERVNRFCRTMLASATPLAPARPAAGGSAG